MTFQALFNGMVGPVSSETDAVDPTFAAIEHPRVMPISDSQAIIIWIDYNGTGVEGRGIYGCLATVSTEGITVSATVELLPDYEITFSNMCVVLNGYVVAQVARTAVVAAQPVTYSQIVVIGSNGIIPYVVNEYPFQELITTTAAHIGRFGEDDVDDLAYNAHINPVGGNELLIHYGYRPLGYPNPYEWRVGKLYLSSQGALAFLDMDLAPWESYPEASVTLFNADGYVAVWDDDSAIAPDFQGIHVVYSPEGSTTFTSNYNNVPLDFGDDYGYVSHGASYDDHQVEGYMDAHNRFAVDGDVVTLDSKNGVRPDGGEWAEYNNSICLSYIHDRLGNRLVVGTAMQPDSFNEQDFLIYSPTFEESLDVGEASRLFAGTSLGEPYGYFGYSMANMVGNILLIALTSGSDYAYENRNTDDPYQALYLLSYLIGDYPNLDGELVENRRKFWRPRPGW